ncbi:MAG: glutamyl-tRNA reductase [Clostridiales bacterium]|nr:glutamyl-tRNA reductase [Clostridiales bacterium]
MGICMVGIDHNKANVDIRALFSFTKKNAAAAMERWKKIPGINGCVVLSTCNRMEIWASTREDWDGSLIEELCKVKEADPTQYETYFVKREGREAVDHLFHLTCGLKSLILAEDQIITQVKDALALARESYVTDNVLEVLFRKAVTAGKKVKTNVIFSRANQTAMDQAIEMLKAKDFRFQEKKCLVIGNGEMGKLAAQSLKRAGADVTVTVRQYRSGIVAIPMGCSRINYGERLEFLPECDLVVSATASPNYTLTKEQVKEAGLKKHTVFIDLAVPRDMEPELTGLPLAELYTIDDFKLEGPSAGMLSSLEQAEALLSEEIDEFYVWFDNRDVIPRIQEIREDAVTDLNLRLHRILHKLPLGAGEIAELEKAIDTAAGKVVTKMIFGLRDTLDREEFLDCVEGLEKVYEE